MALKTKDIEKTRALLGQKYSRVSFENDYIRVYDEAKAEEIVSYLYGQNVIVTEIKTDKIGLEEYYTDLMKETRRNG